MFNNNLGRKSREDPVGSCILQDHTYDSGRILAGLHNRERLTGSYKVLTGSYLGARLDPIGSYIREAKLVGSSIVSYQKGKLVGSCTTILQK